MAPPKPPIVIGLDFGTTYSGMAWAPSGSYTTLVSGWPSHFGASDDKRKVPTTVVYQPKSKPTWGYQVSPFEQGIKFFKLLLLEESDLSDDIRRSNFLKSAREQLEESGKTAVDVVADYLRELWKFGIKDVQKGLGGSRFAASPLHVVVTLPAIWPPYARMRMREAVRMAGILDERLVQGKAEKTRLTFVGEPEAAALATMNDLEGRVDLETGDQFVVCDAGGGTVDLITYKVINQNPLQIAESVKGDGGLCGAMRLDEAFSELLKSKLPSSVWDKLGQSGIKQIMASQWETHLKPGFHDQAAAMRMPMPFVDMRDGAQTSAIEFSGGELKGVFKPVVAELVKLVMRQMREAMKKRRKAPKYIILVGGLGKSPFVYDTLRRAMCDFKTEVLQASGDRPWTAVCRGAVLRGSEERSSTVGARVARASYGTTLNVVPWCSRAHSSRDRVWCPEQREFLAVDQVQWFIEYGETLETDKPIVHTFWQDMSEPQESVDIEIVYCADKDPPNRCEHSVKKLCMIRWSNLPDFNQLPSWTNNVGDSFRQVQYELRAIPDGTSLEFEVFFHGKVVASQNVDIDSTECGATKDRTSDE